MRLNFQEPPPWTWTWWWFKFSDLKPGWCWSKDNLCPDGSALVYKCVSYWWTLIHVVCFKLTQTFYHEAFNQNTSLTHLHLLPVGPIPPQLIPLSHSAKWETPYKPRAVMVNHDKLAGWSCSALCLHFTTLSSLTPFFLLSSVLFLFM